MNKYPTYRRPKTLTIAHDRTIEGCIGTFRNAEYEGTDAFGVMINTLDLGERSEDKLRSLFNYAGDKPVLAMNYRDQRPDLPPITDEEIVESLITSVRAGADMVDLMGDLFDPNPIELTRDPAAIDKQKALVDRIQGMGAKVLASSHTWKFMTTEETVEHFHALKSIGADMVKIAMCANSDEEADSVFHTTISLRSALDIPYIYICMGQYGKRHRMMAPMLGAEYALCVQQYTADSHREQVLLRSARAVYSNVDWTMARDTTTATIPPF
jgi:3-dehydroquinate dehydratase